MDGRWSVLRAALGDLGLVAFASRCRWCGAVVEGGEWAPLLCGRCAGEFPVWDRAVAVFEPLAGGHALARYEGLARALIVELKFGGLLRAGWALGAAMARAPGARRLLGDVDAVVPVPLHWSRRWRRGHDQAASLARALSRATGLPGWGVLRRTRRTPPQVGLGRADRMINVDAAFRAPRCFHDSIRAARLVLVDDVVTTGATAAAAATALHRAGARSVVVYAAAWSSSRR